MDDLIGNVVKFLSSTVVVRIMSYPSFSIECLLATIVCVVHLLLMFEVGSLVKRTNVEAAAKYRIKRPIREDLDSSCSFHSLVTHNTTQVFHKRQPDYSHQRTFYSPISPHLHKKFSRTNFGYMFSKGDSILRHNFNDRIEHLLSISPSEYVRRDKERKNREKGLRSCIQSLTSLLEKALNNDTLEIQNMSKDEIKKSINALRENFESQLSTQNNYQLADFPSPSLQSLIGQSTAKNALKNSLSPNLISSIYRASNVSFSRSNTETSARKQEEEKNNKSSRETLSIKDSESLSEIFRKLSNEFFATEQKNSRGILTM